MNHWLMKTETSTYSWDNLMRDKKTNWDGVRNFGARNHLRAMKKGDLVFIYHSGDEKAIQGIAKVTHVATPDKAAKEGDWSAVQIAPVRALKNPLSLATIKKSQKLKEMVLVKNSRLSVQPVTKEEWKICIDIEK